VGQAILPAGPLIGFAGRIIQPRLAPFRPPDTPLPKRYLIAATTSLAISFAPSSFALSPKATTKATQIDVPAIENNFDAYSAQVLSKPFLPPIMSISGPFI